MPDQSRAESNKILLDGKKKKFGISIQPGSAISVPQMGSAVSGAISGAIIEEEFEEVKVEQVAVDEIVVSILSLPFYDISSSLRNVLAQRQQNNQKDRRPTESFLNLLCSLNQFLKKMLQIITGKILSSQDLQQRR